MSMENRLGLVKRALGLLLEQLREDDRVGLVVFGSEARLVLAPTGDHAAIAAAVAGLATEGSTNAEAGLRLGFDVARAAFRPGAINRLLLCSDGVANVGATGPETILARIGDEAAHGIQLSTVGFGMGNYNDALMERLADEGDGTYAYVDDLDEARRVFIENLTGTLQTIAQDAKVQVDFDPSQVSQYRLIGFENRDVADHDFRNDAVDAGEIGAGHEVTALYEVKLAPELRRDEPLATVKLRYARPASRGPTQAREISRDFLPSDLSRRFEEASPHFRLDAAAAEFAEILRGSYWARGSRLGDVAPVARDAARTLKSDTARELASLVRKAARLHRPSEPDEDQ
jgi:Ca-activated chloride channel family protein